MSLEKNNYSTKDFLHTMSICKITPPERIHWGKMLVPPKKGESFLSWVMRQAWKFRMTPRELIQSEKDYWLQKENISLSFYRGSYWPLLSDVLPIPSWENAFKKRGLNADISELQLDISKWFDLYKEPEIHKNKLKNYYYYSLRYCPNCWKDEDGRYFKTIWRLPFVIVCPEHGVELREFCSSCEKPLFRHIRSDTISITILANFHEEWILKCRHCNHSLLDEIDEIPELAKVQNKILITLQSDSYWATQRSYLIFWHTFKNIVENRKYDSAETKLKLIEQILEKPILMPDSNFYSQELIAELDRRLQAVTLYLSGNPANNLANQFGLPANAIRTMSKDLIKGESIDEIVKRRLGFEGKFGLEFAKCKLLEFKAKHDRLPKSKDKEIGGIITAINRSEWALDGIKTWNDLLRNTFGDVNNETGIYTGGQGLNQAMAELRNFKIENNRLPICKDKVTGGIIAAINRGEWTFDGIRTWNDLLRKIFGEINNKIGIYTDTGEQGLNQAMAELRNFKIEHSRLPTSKEKVMREIITAINRSEWTLDGIKTWNDLLRKTFGGVNKERGLYTGEQGLKHAMAELRNFKIENNRLPRVVDTKMGGIIGAISRGERTFDGIKTWNDLLRKTFGEVNIENGKYTGEQGLNQAMAELRNFKIENNRLPTCGDKMMGGIKGAINRGEWTFDGIKTWNDLLRKTFGDVNRYREIANLEKNCLTYSLFSSL